MEIEKNDKKFFDWALAVKLALNLFLLIALPIVIAFFAGSYLDKKHDSFPRYFLIALIVAFFVSIAGLIRYVLRETKKIEASYREQGEDKK